MYYCFGINKIWRTPLLTCTGQPWMTYVASLQLTSCSRWSYCSRHTQPVWCSSLPCASFFLCSPLLVLYASFILFYFIFRCLGTYPTLASFLSWAMFGLRRHQYIFVSFMVLFFIFKCGAGDNIFKYFSCLICMLMSWPLEWSQLKGICSLPEWVNFVLFECANTILSFQYEGKIY